MYMDLELLEWLNTVTFPEEARYSDLNYAEKAYSIFADDLKKSATTRASIFGTLHVDATELLMDLMEKTGLKAYIGKINMDRNGSKALQEESAVVSATDTVRWLNDIAGKYENVKPILTPRFTPSCSDELMSRLAEIQQAYCLPVQSHLSENKSDIAWVKELCPNTSFYGEAYDQFGLFGGKTCPTIMAHCVYSSDAELSLMKDRGVFIAHCPQSNTNLSSGIAPVRRYLEEGLHIGLGTDIAGGHSLSMLRAIADAILADEISVFKAGQMTGICTEAYSASECKCGWLFCHMSYLLLAVGTCPQAKKIPNIFARRVTVTSNTYRQLLR